GDTVAEVKVSVRRWFRALSLLRSGAEGSPTIPMILKALDPPGNAELSPSLAARLTMSALRGRPLPSELLRHALLRFRSDRGGSSTFPIAATIKACLVLMSPPKLKETDVSLDEENSEQSYLLGRL